MALLGVEGYFDALLAFLDHAVAQGFVSPEHRALLQVEEDPDALLRRLAIRLPAGDPSGDLRGA